MATVIETTGKRVFVVNMTRQRMIGIVLAVIGALMLWRANSDLNYAVSTTLTLDAGPLDRVPHVVVPTLAFLNVTAIVFIISGLLALNPPPSLARLSTGLLIVSGILIVPTLLIASAAGGRTNVTIMFAESLKLATPIAIGAMAGIWCERSGVVNIAIEGMMLTAACFGFTAFFFLRQPMADQLGLAQLIAVIVGVLTGGLVALLHAWLSITFRTDQIVSGTVINILAVGVTSFVRREYLLSSEAGMITLPTVRLPILADIPIIGPALFNNQPIFYLMFVVIALTHIMLFHTRWGLRMRAVGEHPHAADTLGINVNQTRWANVFIGGLIAGLAGAWFTLERTGRFSDGMTRGSGFIALAAMIFGKWTPLGAFGGALLFGFSDALGTRFQALNVPVPVQFLQMVPYLVTLVVLAGLIGRALPPKAVGKPYVKEE